MKKSSALNERGHDSAAAKVAMAQWAIGLRGMFNPGIFHPAWFDLHGVAQKGIAATAQIGSIETTKSSMSLGDMHIAVDLGAFEVRTTNEPEIRLLEFVTKIFGEVLPFTKIRAFNINKSVHFKAASSVKRVEIFDELVPNKFWGPFGERISNKRDSQSAGLRSAGMREMLEDDDSVGFFEALVEPSVVLSGTEGIYLSTNRFFEMKNLMEQDGAAKAISKLEKVFENTIAICDETIDHFVKRAT